MYHLIILLTDSTDNPIVSSTFDFQDKPIAQTAVDFAIDEIKKFIDFEQHAPEGRIITLLPPDRIHTVEGVVTPKVPFQVAREQAQRLKETPNELAPPEEVQDDDQVSAS